LTSPGPAGRLAPLRLPGFRHLAGAYGFNELGNWVGEIALAVLVYDETGSPLATAALFLGMQFLPGFLGQAVVARFEPMGTKLMLPALYLAEAATFVALAMTVDNFSLALVVVLATVDGTLAIAARAFTRASAAAVLTPAGLMREGNGIINVGFTGAGAVGPALAGVIVAALGTQTALLVDAASFVAVAATLAVARSLPQVKAQPERWRIRLREGLAYVSSRPTLRRLMTAQALAFVFFTLVLPIEIVYAKETLDAGNEGYGALLSAWGVGMVIGSLVFVVRSRARMTALLFFSTLALGLSYLGMAAAGTLLVACLAAAVGGAGNGVQWVAVMSAVQELTEAQYQARVAGLLESLAVMMPGIGFVLGGVVTELLDPRASFAVAGSGVLLVLFLAVPLLRGASWGAPGGAEAAEGAQS
jgi:predicted MFS family arabinose efflux permease